MQIHPQALVSPRAKIGKDVFIGPFCIIEDEVEIGSGCHLEARVTVKNGTSLGENNFVYEGTVLGGFPQHLAVHDECGDVVVGNGNIIRENSTIHRAMTAGQATELGNNCMLMVNAHIAHDCRVGDNVILANNTMLAGHVTVGNRANLSGAVGVHQFCRIGAYAMVGGQAHITQDVPPYMLIDGLTSQIVNLNLIGLRRNGFTLEDVKQLKAAFRIVYRSSLSWRDILERLEQEFTNSHVVELRNFLSTTTRGIVSPRKSQALERERLERERREKEEKADSFGRQSEQETADSAPVTLRIHREDDDQINERIERRNSDDDKKEDTIQMPETDRNIFHLNAENKDVKKRNVG